MKRFSPVFSWLMICTIPFFLMIASVRILLNPWFLGFEYQSAGFPEDTFGFNLQDRLKWSRYAVDYLVNAEGIDYLGKLTFEDGSPLYNERELSHMLDVKKLVQACLNAWMGMAGIYLLLAASARRNGTMKGYWAAWKKGGWATVGLIAFILIGVAISFRDLFTQFHRIFFSGDTWLFLFSDTLIRLFPMRFWQDAFIGLGVLTLGMAFILIFLGGYFSKISRES